MCAAARTSGSISSARHRLGNLLLRREIHWEGPGEAWSRKHRSWPGHDPFWGGGASEEPDDVKGRAEADVGLDGDDRQDPPLSRLDEFGHEVGQRREDSVLEDVADLLDLDNLGGQVPGSPQCARGQRCWSWERDERRSPLARWEPGLTMIVVVMVEVPFLMTMVCIPGGVGEGVRPSRAPRTSLSIRLVIRRCCPRVGRCSGVRSRPRSGGSPCRRV